MDFDPSRPAPRSPGPSSSGPVPLKASKADGILFIRFCKLCDDILRLKTKDSKDLLIDVWKELGDADAFPFMRLLLPGADDERPTYGLRDKGLGLAILSVLGIPPNTRDGKRVRYYTKPDYAGPLAGNFARVVKQVTKSRLSSAADPNKQNLTIGQVNELLDQVCHTNDKKERHVVLCKLFTKLCCEEMFWLCRIVLKDMKMRIGRDTVLKYFHKHAMDIFNASTSLRKVCACVADPVKMRKELNQLTLFSAVSVMMCARVLPYTNIVPEMDGNPFSVEPKFDGERIQIHKRGDEIRLYTRQSVDVTSRYGYGLALRDTILRCVSCDTCIIDCEIVAWDPINSKFHKFGSNRTIAAQQARRNIEAEKAQSLDVVVRPSSGIAGVKIDKAKVPRKAAESGEFRQGDWICAFCKFHNFAGRAVCFRSTCKKPRRVSPSSASGGAMLDDYQNRLCIIAFDILLSDGVNWTDKPLRERREELERVVLVESKRFEIIERRRDIRTTEALMEWLDTMLDRGYEGLVIKDLSSPYTLGARIKHWIKLKPDYVEGHLTDMDLVILGGYYGKGSSVRRNRVGKVSHFLMGVRGTPRNLSSYTGQKSSVVNWNRMRSSNGQYPDFESPPPAQASGPSARNTPPADDDLKSNLWSTFCKVGTGYTDQELETLRSRLDLVPSRRVGRQIEMPSWLVPSTRLERDDIPDFWVRDPEQSIVLELRAAEITATLWTKFRAKFTLRHPRVVSIRYDKPVQDALTWSGMFDIALNADRRGRGGAERAARAILASDGKQRRRSGKRRAPLSVDPARLTVNASTVDVKTNVFQKSNGRAYSFCVYTADLERRSALERHIIENGGECRGSPLQGTTDYIVTGRKVSVRVKAQIKNRNFDVVRHEWVEKCIRSGRLLPFQFDDVVHATEALQNDMNLRMDEFGDPWTGPVTLEEFRRTLDRVTEMRRKRKRVDSELNQLQPNEPRRPMAPISTRYACMRGTLVYFDVFDTIGDPKTRDWDSSLVIAESQLKNLDGVRASYLAPKVTHVVVDVKRPDRYRALSLALKKAKFNADPAIVSSAWVDACARDLRQHGPSKFRVDLSQKA